MDDSFFIKRGYLGILSSSSPRGNLEIASIQELALRPHVCASWIELICRACWCLCPCCPSIASELKTKWALAISVVSTLFFLFPLLSFSLTSPIIANICIFRILLSLNFFTHSLRWYREWFSPLLEEICSRGKLL